METKIINSLQLFTNEELNTEIRTVEIDGETWFVAADVAKVLEIQNIRQNLADFPNDEKGVTTIYTLGGPQQINIVNEPGLYRLIFNSRKPEAEKFKRWVYHEVLPSIRKTGGYGVYSEVTANLNEAAILLKAAELTKEYLKREKLIDEARALVTGKELTRTEIYSLEQFVRKFIKENCEYEEWTYIPRKEFLARIREVYHEETHNFSDFAIIKAVKNVGYSYMRFKGRYMIVHIHWINDKHILKLK